MSFTEQLRHDAHPIFEAIFNHPFVKGIGEGNLPKEAVAHYVKADAEYLHAFMNVYGTAISKCTDKEDIAFFKENIEFVLHSEIHPHHNLCTYINTPYEDLQGYPLPPTADHYIKHMKTTAHEGTLGEILAVLLPCPWTYLEIGHYLMDHVQPTPEHPFYEWITFYVNDEIQDTTNQLRSKLDAWAETASPREKKAMKDAFIKSCQLEWAFWEMAYRQETWPTSAIKEVTRHA
ncbi:MULTISPECIES: thiaminase II [Pontibacillus]|uniref:Aminopyrimidine aminohydrolase n=1 Tax=Pontibacillus chungwhensis TaxID=265426 RepID=A0ABY8V0V0_9BACI|nr:MULTISPECIES: thiaminase II [Pontibacillus]MCD5322278.1 thiaminase II [Pontibacillus sp. HN14]WIF99570.1 thiaminase II [Pontibacillus chungwhensis]